MAISSGELLQASTLPALEVLLVCLVGVGLAWTVRLSSFPQGIQIPSACLTVYDNRIFLLLVLSWEISRDHELMFSS